MHWFQSFNCAGDEESVFDCPRDLGIGEVGFCTHSFDASVICQGNGLVHRDFLSVLTILLLVGKLMGSLKIMWHHCV